MDYDILIACVGGVTVCLLIVYAVFERRRKNYDEALQLLVVPVRFQSATCAHDVLPPMDNVMHVALHEAGHAVVAWHLPSTRSVNRIAIRAEGEVRHALLSGYTLHNNDSRSRGAMTDRLLITMAGIAAEMRFAHTIHLEGARGDFAFALLHAEALLARFPESHGFDPDADWDADALIGDRLPFDAFIDKPISPKVRGLLDAAYRRAAGIVNDHNVSVLQLATVLYETCDVRQKRIRAILGTSRRELDAWSSMISAVAALHRHNR